MMLIRSIMLLGVYDFSRVTLWSVASTWPALPVVERCGAVVKLAKDATIEARKAFIKAFHGRSGMSIINKAITANLQRRT